MRADIEDADLMDALGETSLLHGLGMRSVPGPQARPPIGSGAVGTGRISAAEPNLASLPGEAVSIPADVLWLNGSREARIGTRTFTLSEEEMIMVTDMVGQAYERAMAAELARIRETIVGKTVHPVPEGSSPTHTSHLRNLPRPEALEAADGRPTHDGTVLELRAGITGSAEVPGVPGPEAGGGTPVASPPVPEARGNAGESPRPRVKVRADRIVASSATEGGRKPAGGSH